MNPLFVEKKKQKQQEEEDKEVEHHIDEIQRITAIRCS